jgi:hypothetical protein
MSDVITLRLALSPTSGLSSSMSMGSYWGVVFVSYRCHFIGKVLVATESLCGSGRPQPECDEVEGLSLGGKGSVNPLPGGGEVSEPLGGGSVASDVRGDPPVFEDSGPLQEGAEAGLGGVHELSEPLGQGFLGVRVVVHWGPIGGRIEGETVDWVLRSSHRSLCCSRVRGAYPDIPGLCFVALVRYGEVWESPSIGNKSRGSGWLGVDRIWSNRDTESGDLPPKALDEAGVRSGSGSAELFSVILDLLDMGLGASSERPCGDFSQSAKDLRGGARSLFVEVLDDGEG